MKTKTIIAISSLAVLLIGFLIVKADTWPFVGNSFSWIGNNLVNTNQGKVEQGDPVIGMIKMNGNRYQVAIEGTGPTRLLTGAAWFGIGTRDDKFNDFSDQGDLPSLGWVLFNQGVPPNNCFGAGDCHPATWYQKPGVTGNSYDGYISGWAKLGIGANGDQSPYPETWLHFKGPANPSSYTCGDKNYFVCVDVNGRLEGYAWSSGASSATLDGNPGFGWIKFSKQYAGVVPASYTPQSITCKTQFESGNNCTNFGAFTGKFDFKAVYQGTTDPDNMLRWICKDGDAPQPGDKVSCVFKDVGNYQPKLEYWSVSDTNWKSCDSNASVEVASAPKCKVLVAEEGTSVNNIEDYSSKTTIMDNSLANALIKNQCSQVKTINWAVDGQARNGGSLIQVEPNGVGNIKVGASVTDTAGKTYECAGATVTVKSSTEGTKVKIR